MITLSLAPSGAVQAFAEALNPSDRGYYLDLPEDPTDFKRALLQVLLSRQARKNQQHPQDAIDVNAIAKWLELNPPIPRTKTGQPIKAVGTLDDLKDIFG